MLAFLTRRSRDPERSPSRPVSPICRGYRTWLSAGAALFAATPVLAQETINYTYDARGRLITVKHSGGANDGVSATYTYDPADNRTNVTVTGAATSGDGGSGASVPTSLFIVVPLNGYTLIKVR